MLKTRAFGLFFVSVLFGLGAAYVANHWLNSYVSEPVAKVEATAPEMVPIVVAALDIPFGQPIEAAHLRTILWPEESAPKHAYHDVSQVEGLVANQAIIDGELIVQGRVVEKLGGSTLSALLEPDKRAVTVRVNDVIGVAGFLLPGNRVDVLATRMVDKRAYTRTLLIDIKVLAVDQTASQDKDRPQVVRAVTLEMDPTQAEKLVAATEEGSVQLALRNPAAEEPPPKAVVKRSTRPPKQTSTTVTVIRGTNVDVSKVQL